VEKSEKNRPLGSNRRKWENVTNIKMDNQEMGYRILDLAQDRTGGGPFTVMNILVHRMREIS
jgi:hypothetical protein